MFVFLTAWKSRLLDIYSFSLFWTLLPLFYFDHRVVMMCDSQFGWSLGWGSKLQWKYGGTVTYKKRKGKGKANSYSVIK